MNESLIVSRVSVVLALTLISTNGVPEWAINSRLSTVEQTEVFMLRKT